MSCIITVWAAVSGFCWPCPALSPFLVLVGCGPNVASVAQDSGVSSGATGPVNPSTSASGGPSVTAAATTAVSTSFTTSATSDDTTMGGFLDPTGCGIAPEGFEPRCGGLKCSTAVQDCPDDQRCTVWANDGGEAYNASICVPRSAAPSSVGQVCTVEASLSGFDSCELGAVCLNVDDMLLVGTCVAFCTGPANDFACEDPNHACGVFNDHALTVCLETCDPLGSGCANGQSCHSADTDSAFVCLPSGTVMFDGAGYELSACDVGSRPVDAELVTSCVPGEVCCAEYCSPIEQDCAVGECVEWQNDIWNRSPVGVCVDAF